MIPSWYDVLGVEADASAAEVRAAWQESIAGLDPTDRRFKQRNRAAEVLLDPARRASHDADLAAAGADDEDDEDDEDDADDVLVASVDPAPGQRASAPGPAPAVGRRPSLEKAPAANAPGTDQPGTDQPEAQTPVAARAGAGVPDGQDEDDAERGIPWLTLAVGFLAAVLVVMTVVAFARGGETAAVGDGSASSSTAPDATDGDLPDLQQVDAARAAAEVAIVPVLAYDYRDLERSKQAALSFLTTSFGAEYRRNFEGVIEPNARRTRTIVNVDVVSSAISRVEPDSVDVLLFVNRPTRNAVADRTYRDQVTARMVDVEGTWLVDCLIATPDGVCGV